MSLPTRGRAKISIFDFSEAAASLAPIPEVLFSGIMDEVSVSCVGKTAYEASPSAVSSWYVNSAGTGFVPSLTLSSETILDENRITKLSPDYSGLLSGRHNAPPSDDTSSSVYESLLAGKNYKVEVGLPANTDINAPRYVSVSHLFGPKYEEVQGLAATSQSWLRYNAQTGNLSNIFAFSLEMVRDISGYGASMGVSGKGLELVDWSPEILNGYCSKIKTALSGCQINDAEFSDLSRCLTGEVSQELLESTISGILRQSLSRRGVVPSSSLPNSVGGDGQVDLASQLYRYAGHVSYNQPIAGDSICIRTFTDSRTNEYKSIYNSEPPYTGYYKCFTYGVDFSSINSLVTAINNALYYTPHQTWQQSQCETLASGRFESGPVLRATKTDNNTIRFESQVFGDAGAFGLSITSGDRTANVNVKSFFLPDRVALEGLDASGNWVSLLARSGIDWLALEPTLSVSETSISPISSGLSGAMKPAPEKSPQVQVSGSGNLQLLYTVNISGKDACGKDFQEDVPIYKAIAPKYCKQDTDPLNEESDKKDAMLSGILGGEVSGEYFVMSKLRTGWLVDVTGAYKEYRLALSEMSSYVGQATCHHAGEIYATNLSFYGRESSARVFSGESCIFGATYQNHIRGYASGVITGTASGLAESGFHDFSRDSVYGTPLNNTVRFNNAVGKPIGLFTGACTGSITGTGFYTDYVNCVRLISLGSGSGIGLSGQVSGVITGSGLLVGGPYYFVNESYARTGIKDTVYAFNPSGLFLVNGPIKDVPFPFSRGQAFGYLDVTIAASQITGYKDFSGVITGYPSQAFYAAPTGYSNATGSVAVVSPVAGDIVLLNGLPVVYGTGSGQSAPSYFNSAATLASIINSGVSRFSASASLSGSIVKLLSAISGSSGNLIELSVIGSTGLKTSSSSLIGGAEVYPFVTVSSPFTGIWSKRLYAVQSHSLSGSGVFTGDLPVFLYKRTFTGIWNLRSGDIDFSEANKVTSGKYFGVVSSEMSPVSLPLDIQYVGPYLQNNTDVARLFVRGINFPSSSSVLITGKPN
jgi:hypothetical protein